MPLVYDLEGLPNAARQDELVKLALQISPSVDPSQEEAESLLVVGRLKLDNERLIVN
ncbi:hypothetical protein KHA96_20425 [Bacillus sp. FJAT-49711]|uniref:hypothetical protein n=1 Tax=Bacillus sp. FJAT-49711 TaxID=2833585 RepID=UPI001BC95D86|nr:hypothetical protein [Bacillus sp. FJAT-49711]MBS4220667.1 hypothetical protein [Bacillus sp. FJAT-49711]